MWREIERVVPITQSLALAVIIGCSGNLTTRAVQLPVKSVLRAPQAEQLQVLQSRGKPDRAWLRQVKVTVWAFCDTPSHPLLVEFDCEGRVLWQWQTTDKRFCSNSSEIVGEIDPSIDSR